MALEQIVVRSLNNIFFKHWMPLSQNGEKKTYCSTNINEVMFVLNKYIIRQAVNWTERHCPFPTAQLATKPLITQIFTLVLCGHISMRHCSAYEHLRICKDFDNNQHLVRYYKQVIALRENEEIDWLCYIWPSGQAAPAAGGGTRSFSERHLGG